MVGKVLFILLFSFSFVNVIYSQAVGNLTGRVIDRANQQPLEGVAISVLSKDNVIAGSETDQDGFYTINSIGAGFYSVRFSLFGFETYIVRDIEIRSGTPTDLFIEMDIITTEEIVVENDRLKNPSDISNSYKTLSFEEIRRSPGGFEDIGRVLQTLPGVSFVNDGRNDLLVRGGSPTENLFIVDNSVIPNINHFGSQGATGGPVSIINLSFIRDVSFITGGFPAKYGDKLSSVLELKLREGNREEFVGDINLSATGFGAIFEGPIGSDKKGSWLVSARRSYLDLIFNAAGFGFVPEYTSFQGKVVYDFNDKLSLSVNAIGNLDKVIFNNDDEENKQDNEDILKNNQTGYVNSYELKWLMSPRSYSRINLSRNFVRFDYSARDSLFNERFKNRSDEGETSLKIEYTFNPSPVTIVETGSGIRFINFQNEIFQDEDTLSVINPETGEPFVLPALDINSDNNTLKGFAYAQLSQTVLNGIIINAGLRYDYFGFINKKNYLSPRVSLTVPIIGKLKLGLSYGIFYQSPSYIWLISNSANKNLSNIRADHYVAGLEYSFSNDTKFSIEAYYKNYQDYPVSELRPYFVLANNGGNFENVDEFGLEPLVSAGTGFSRGIELYLQKFLTNNFYGTVNFSLFEAKYTSLDGIERRSDFDNRFIFIINGGYRLNDWEFSSKLRYIGGRPYTPINESDGSIDINNYNSETLPNYFSMDVRIDKRWSFTGWSLITYIDIQNVTNRKNITNYEWNKYTNSVEENNSIGLLPSIGINAKF